MDWTFKEITRQCEIILHLVVHSDVGHTHISILFEWFCILYASFELKSIKVSFHHFHTLED